MKINTFVRKRIHLIHILLSKQNVTGYYVPRNNVVSKTVNQKIYSGVPNSAGGGGGGGGVL